VRWEPTKGLLQLNFYQNIHVRPERWEGQTCYDSEEVDRNAFSSPSLIKFLTPAYPALGRDRGRQALTLAWYRAGRHPVRTGRSILTVKDWAS
jgi:hypothetical protein